MHKERIGEIAIESQVTEGYQGRYQKIQRDDSRYRSQETNIKR